MNNLYLKNKLKSISWVFLILLFTSCSEYLNDPLIDKNTGEEIEFFIIDEEFFNTKMSYRLLDAESKEPIRSNATIIFSGQNGNDIITYLGKKQSSFFTNLGRLELTVDPGVPISEESPFKYTINVAISGYQSFTKDLQIVEEEEQTIELFLSRN